MHAIYIVAGTVKNATQNYNLLNIVCVGGGGYYNE
jgi:hypothetical protein